MANPKDTDVYESALAFALQQIMGRGKATLLEAMLGLHWALAKKLWQAGKAAGQEQAMVDLEALEVVPEDEPKGFRKPPAREKRKPKGKGS